MATATICALAIAAPVAGASAATPVPIEVAGGEFAYGGIAIADVFNGGTTVVVSTAPAVATTIDYPWW